MAFIPGHSTSISPQVMVGSGAAAGPGAARSGVVPGANPASVNAIDGTPVRVVVLAFAAAAGLWALRLAGFRFNVGVSAGG